MNEDRTLAASPAMRAQSAQARYLISEQSRNAKTGPIMVVTSDASTCPDACPLKASNACYAKHGPLGGLWRNLSAADGDATTIPNGRERVPLKGFSDLLDAIARQGGKLWRMNQAGDLPGDGDTIDGVALASITLANHDAKAQGFTYTHKPVTGDSRDARNNRHLIQRANEGGFTVNLSADNLADADAKAALGIGPVAVVLPSDSQGATTPEGRKVVVCPAISGKAANCAACGLCQKQQRKVIVGFPAHGAAKNKASRIAS